MSHPSDSLAAHFEGCLAGAMIGDCLGSRVENVSAALVAHRYPTTADLGAIRPGAYGSTTEATVALAESLLEQPEFDGEDFAARLLRGWHEARGYGQGTLLALARLRSGVPWQEAGAGYAGRGCYGNAAAARSAPVGLVHAEDPATLRWVAEEAAGVTHTHAHGVEGAVVLALGVAAALDGRGEDVDAGALLETIASQVQVREYRSHLEMAASMSARAWAPARVADRLGNNQTALGSVVTSLLCFAVHADDATAAAAAALQLGGNATATVSMTLAMAGARLGVEALPAAWLDARVDGPVSVGSVRRLGRALAALG